MNGKTLALEGIGELRLLHILVELYSDGGSSS